MRSGSGDESPRSRSGLAQRSSSPAETTRLLEQWIGESRDLAVVGDPDRKWSARLVDLACAELFTRILGSRAKPTSLGRTEDC